MRVMLDTNILISAIVFRSKPMNSIIHLLAEKYSLILCSYIINELHDVVNEKFEDRKNDLEKFLLELPFELVYTPQSLPKHGLFTISDTEDEKILYSAIIADADHLPEHPSKVYQDYFTFNLSTTCAWRICLK